MIFAGYDFSQYWYVRPDRPLVASRTVIERQVPGMQGARFVRSSLDPIDIPVELRLRLPQGMTDPTTVNHVKRLAAERLNVAEPAELVFYSEPDVHYMAVVLEASGFDNPAYAAGCSVTFHCPDPLAYHRVKRVLGLHEGANELTVHGSFEVLPIFELTTRAADRVRVAYGDRFVEAVGPFDDGTRLAIDCQTGFVYREGVVSQFTLQSRFFTLPSGDVTVEVSGIASGTVTFAERSV